jgi:hypothetical protein
MTRSVIEGMISAQRSLLRFPNRVWEREKVYDYKEFYIAHLTTAFLKYLYKSIRYELQRIQKGDND